MWSLRSKILQTCTMSHYIQNYGAYCEKNKTVTPLILQICNSLNLSSTATLSATYSKYYFELESDAKNDIIKSKDWVKLRPLHPVCTYYGEKKTCWMVRFAWGNVCHCTPERSKRLTKAWMATILLLMVGWVMCKWPRQLGTAFIQHLWGTPGVCQILSVHGYKFYQRSTAEKNKQV